MAIRQLLTLGTSTPLVLLVAILVVVQPAAALHFAGNSQGAAAQDGWKLTSSAREPSTAVFVNGMSTLTTAHETFLVSILNTSSPVTEGQTINVTVNVTNRGGSAGRQTLELVAGASILDASTVSLGAGNSTVVTLTWTTVIGDSGTRSLTVRSLNDSATTSVTIGPVGTLSFEGGSDGDTAPPTPWYLSDTDGLHQVSASRSTDGNLSLHLSGASSLGKTRAVVDVNLTDVSTIKADIFLVSGDVFHGDVKIDIDNSSHTIMGVTGKTEGQWYRNLTGNVSEYRGVHSVVLRTRGPDNEAYFDNIRIIQNGVVNKSDPTAYDSIQKAVADANEGATIEVHGGTYHENLTIDKNITLVGIDTPQLNGSTLSAPTAITIPMDSAAQPVFRGFDIQNYSTGVKAVKTDGSWTLANVSISDTETGVNAFAARGDWSIRSSSIADNGDGVFANGTTGKWRITRTSIQRNEVGLFAGTTSGAWKISESVIEGNEHLGISAALASPAGNASYNYWGAPNGPSGDFSGAGDAINGNVTASPYYVNRDLIDLTPIDQTDEFLVIDFDDNLNASHSIENDKNWIQDDDERLWTWREHPTEPTRGHRPTNNTLEATDFTQHYHDNIGGNFIIQQSGGFGDFFSEFQFSGHGVKYPNAPYNPESISVRVGGNDKESGFNAGMIRIQFRDSSGNNIVQFDFPQGDGTGSFQINGKIIESDRNNGLYKVLLTNISWVANQFDVEIYRQTATGYNSTPIFTVENMSFADGSASNFDVIRTRVVESGHVYFDALKVAGKSDPDVAVLPTSHDYGAVTVGTTATANVTITNIGIDPLNVTDVSLIGANASAFVHPSNRQLDRIASGDAHNLTVGFVPSEVGTKTATLMIATNDSVKPTVNVSLTGKGVGVVSGPFVDDFSDGDLTEYVVAEGDPNDWSTEPHIDGQSLHHSDGADADGEALLMLDPATHSWSGARSMIVQFQSNDRFTRKTAHVAFGDGSDLWKVRVHVHGDAVVLGYDRANNGTDEIVARRSLTINDSSLHRVNVTVNRQTITVRLDGIAVLNHTHSEQIGAGSVGVGGAGGLPHETWFDNLTIIPIDRSPVAKINATSREPLVGTRVGFTALSSHDTDGNITNYRWDFDADGSPDATGVAVTHAFDSPGLQPVSLQVVDADGMINTTRVPIRVRTTEEFSTGLNGWTVALNESWVRDRVDPGIGSWSSRFNGSVRLHVNGGPNHMGLFHAMGPLEKGTQIVANYESSNLEGSPGGPRIILHLPNGTSHQLDWDKGRGEHNGTLVGTVSEDLPAGTYLEFRLGVWPGEITVYVENISVHEPDATLTIDDFTGTSYTGHWTVTSQDDETIRIEDDYLHHESPKSYNKGGNMLSENWYTADGEVTFRVRQRQNLSSYWGSGFGIRFENSSILVQEKKWGTNDRFYARVNGSEHKLAEATDSTKWQNYSLTINFSAMEVVSVSRGSTRYELAIPIGDSVSDQFRIEIGAGRGHVTHYDYIRATGSIRPVVPSRPRVSLEPVETSVDAQTTTNLTLSEAPAGISEYNVTISMANGTVANITEASYPSFGQVGTTIGTGNDSATLKVTDLNGKIEAGTTNPTLATLAIRGTTPGLTNLTIDINQLNDDNGDALNATTESARLQVRACSPLTSDLAAPSDPDSDGDFEDTNGNGRFDFQDIVVLFEQKTSAQAACQDFNHNGRIDFDDIVTLFEEI